MSKCRLDNTAGIRLPGLEDVPAGWAAWGALPNSVVGQMVLTWIFMEMANRDQTGNSEFAGDFRNGYLDFGWDSQTAEWKARKRTLELNQGRAAQMGVLGLMVHDAMLPQSFLINYRMHFEVLRFFPDVPLFMVYSECCSRQSEDTNVNLAKMVKSD